MRSRLEFLTFVLPTLKKAGGAGGAGRDGVNTLNFLAHDKAQAWALYIQTPPTP